MQSKDQQDKALNPSPPRRSFFSRRERSNEGPRAVLGALILVWSVSSGMPAWAQTDQLECPPVQVIFAMDTSGSMNDEAAELCSTISQVESNLAGFGVEVSTELLGLDRTKGGDFSCLTDSVANLLGGGVPGNDGTCDGFLNQSESWGQATAILAQNFPWALGAVRVVVPISDEGACNGDSCQDPGSDRDALDNASALAIANNVFVSPIAGTGSSSCVVGLADDIAAATGGISFLSTDPSLDLAGAIFNLIVDACRSAVEPCDAAAELKLAALKALAGPEPDLFAASKNLEEAINIEEAIRAELRSSLGLNEAVFWLWRASLLERIAVKQLEWLRMFDSPRIQAMFLRSATRLIEVSLSNLRSGCGRL